MSARPARGDMSCACALFERAFERRAETYKRSAQSFLLPSPFPRGLQRQYSNLKLKNRIVLNRLVNAAGEMNALNRP